MAQGPLKPTKKSSSSKSSKPTKQLKPHHRARIIKPKKPTLIAQATLKRKATSGLTGKTERLLAEKAGHLELLGGGKRDKKNMKMKMGGGEGVGGEGKK